MATPVYLEVGAKRTFACSVDWPGWCRSAKDEDGALELLAAYADRYAEVVLTTGLSFPTPGSSGSWNGCAGTAPPTSVRLT